MSDEPTKGNLYPNIGVVCRLRSNVADELTDIARSMGISRSQLISRVMIGWFRWYKSQGPSPLHPSTDGLKMASPDDEGQESAQ